jgi:acetyl esterase/lipase
MLLLLCRCSGPAELRRDVIYSPEAWPVALRADFYRPATEAGVPLVILIHHKGLKGQQDLRWQMRGIARKLVARGYGVLNISYRNVPRWAFPAPVEDIDAALQWVTASASREGIDPDRVALFGYSVGGHIALLAGLRDERVSAIVAGAAPADLMRFEGGVLLEKSLGGKRDEIPERYRAVSPVHQVLRGGPPVFLYHGEGDRLVPALHSRMMKEALDAAGTRNELYLIPGAGHLGAFVAGGDAEDRAIDFLDRVMR